MHLLSSLITVMAGFSFFTQSCYNDSELRAQLDDHERRLQSIEAQCTEMNANIVSLQLIVNAIQEKDFVVNTTPVTENGVEIGYTIVFSKSGPVTIYHGRNGADGADGEDG